jgi:hypothetical protein
MEEAAGLWKAIYESFEYHRKDVDPDAQSAMNRVAMNCLHLSMRRSFDPSNCRVYSELLKPEQLHGLKRYHEREAPYHLRGPIVVLSFQGQPYVIEGNNRVNAWVNRQFRGPFSVIFVVPSENAV